ncbi:nucleoporin p54 [Diorhabda carinulata]|uniref:nucleoporin p54 n=1 Tax=Diorhabda carinulata TaxID=1163345 RepID=UPI00259FF9E3|nr:nucleoporin p54 [Diorhabda carinulata]
MAFNFGNTSQSTFGGAPKLTGFGTSFGSTPATTASTGFGGFGSTFGATNTQQQSTGFGTFGTTSTAPTFGTSFGTPASSAPSAFGSTFGAPAATATPSFGSSFGTQQTQPNLFGTATTTAPSLFGSTTSAPSLFSNTTGGGLFGSTSTTQSSGLFGTAATTTTPSLFGTTPTPSLFGQQAVTSTPSLFGTAGTGTTFGTNVFGTSTTSAPSLFGTGFGTTSTSSTGFGGFGGGTGSTFGGFGTQNQGSLFSKPQIPQVAPQQSQTSKTQQVVASVYAINVFNDERDDILKKWNMLQACWGTGKGYYNSQQPPIEYDAQNPFYRFKAMGYNVIPEHDNSEGIVKFIFNKKLDEMKNQQEVLKNGIAGILGNKPNLTVDIHQIKSVTDTQTEVKITVSEKGVTGTSRKIPASDLAAFFNQPVPKQQLSTVMVTSVTPFVTPTKAELEEYLKHPPPGIDLQMWRAAIDDNPNPKKYIPIPINGFSSLRSRLLHQEYQTGLHQAFLDKVNKDITSLKTRHSSSVAQIAELKSKFCELQHRILRILVKQECTRKTGIAILPEEELLRGRFEIMHQQLNNPKQFKGQVNEILSNIKMLAGRYKQSCPSYRLDAEAQEEIKQFLKMEQSGIAQLINIIQTDLKVLNIINDGLKQKTINGQFN